jgi:hypothetical protein
MIQIYEKGSSMSIIEDQKNMEENLRPLSQIRILGEILHYGRGLLADD